jgi:DNA invertase Pin-like site-specific DNA recombinase
VRSALEWAWVRALVADGVSQREIARGLGMNRRTVEWLGWRGGTAALSACTDGVAARFV